MQNRVVDLTEFRAAKSAREDELNPFAAIARSCRAHQVELEARLAELRENLAAYKPASVVDLPIDPVIAQRLAYDALATAIQQRRTEIRAELDALRAPANVVELPIDPLTAIALSCAARETRIKARRAELALILEGRQ